MKEKANVLRRQAEERAESKKQKALIGLLTCAVCEKVACAPVVKCAFYFLIPTHSS